MGRTSTDRGATEFITNILGAHLPSVKPGLAVPERPAAGRPSDGVSTLHPLRETLKNALRDRLVLQLFSFLDMASATSPPPSPPGTRRLLGLLLNTPEEATAPAVAVRDASSMSIFCSLVGLFRSLVRLRAFFVRQRLKMLGYWWRCFRQAGLLVRHRKSVHSLGAGNGLQSSHRGLIKAKIEERRGESSRRSRSSRLGRQRIVFTLSPGRNWRLLVRALGRDAGIPGSIEVGWMWSLGGSSPPVSPPRWSRGRGLVPLLRWDLWLLHAARPSIVRSWLLV
ncbi:hypothetical protein THAOC_12532 [Thalassiosira oceanica]|uniref:Uncharacterized protein n=1 Tax=Thalassiosira oceanica TaxID=159749 RepID=K0SZS9_THAOC|nr:hypothetical protein THAOC_12532 [Thalassiosira oceanica]|eukprot:EJK66546.1 hypothetical protein THAOC_12532 [Thalassiosira oceanica]